MVCKFMPGTIIWACAAKSVVRAINVTVEGKRAMFHAVVWGPSVAAILAESYK